MHKININGRKLKQGWSACNTRLATICPPFWVSMETLVSTVLGERMIRSIEVIRFVYCAGSFRFRSSAGGGGGDPRMLERRKSVRFVGEPGRISCVGEILVENSWRGLESGLLASSSVSIFCSKEAGITMSHHFRHRSRRMANYYKTQTFKNKQNG